MPFNLGWTEILLVLVVALVIFGPGKLPEVGRSMGKTLREFKLAMNKIDVDIKKEVDDIKENVGVDDIKDAVNPTTLLSDATSKATPSDVAETSSDTATADGETAKPLA